MRPSQQARSYRGVASAYRFGIHHEQQQQDTARTGSAEPHFLGTRIRGLRKRRGMTLAELAQQSELTAGYISQLERNLAYPSIPALFNIARSLGVTIQWFFASEAVTAPEDDGIVVRKHSRLNVHYEDGIVDQLLTPQPNRQLEMLHSRFPPGTYSQQSYSHDGEEAGYLLSGQLRVVGRRALLSSSMKATVSVSPARSRTATATLARWMRW